MSVVPRKSLLSDDRASAGVWINNKDNLAAAQQAGTGDAAQVCQRMMKGTDKDLLLAQEVINQQSYRLFIRFGQQYRQQTIIRQCLFLPEKTGQVAERNFCTIAQQVKFTPLFEDLMVPYLAGAGDGTDRYCQLQFATAYHQGVDDCHADRQAQGNGGAAARQGVNRQGAPNGLDGVLNHIHPYATTGDVGNPGCRRKPRGADQQQGLLQGQGIRLWFGEKSLADRFGTDTCRVHAPAVVTDLQQI
jgi:hypothetical protein